jgi:hypothetical protein
MAGRMLTTQSQMQCPHGGTVTAVSSNTVMAENGAQILVMTDTCTIAGCPFQIPAPSGTVPSPCIKVQWTVGDTMVKINGVPTLSESSVGLCLSAQQIPQGTVIVANTQSKAQSR